MRIEQLDLIAFGPFTDRVLKFEGAGLHVVYGPNEAGKSSALRALTALLYGIENSTTDNHLHINNTLRIGGLLRGADGQQLELVRRKGRINTLLASDGATLDEQVLAPYLQGVTRELFTTLFGIDHKALVQGGRDILEQKGDVGQALFSAALGSHMLHEVLAELDQEAMDLFKPKGSKQKINSALKSHADVEKDLANISLASSKWETHQKALEHSTTELQRINTELETSRSQMNRLERIQRVLPYLGKRRFLLTELEQLGDVVVLPDGFAERRQKAENELDKAQVMLDSRTPRRESLRSDLQHMSVNSDLLAQAESIQDLHARLDSYRKALLEHPGLEAEEQQLVTDARSILRQIRPDLEWQDVESLRTILSRKAAVNDLVKQHPLTQSKLAQTESELGKRRHRLQAVCIELDQLAPVSPTILLRRQITASRSLGELGKTIESTRGELDSLNAQCGIELSRLNFWNGQLDQLVNLRLPGREAVDQFDEDFKQHTTRLQLFQREQEENTLALQKTKQALNEIKRAGQVVTEDEVLSLRSERDTLWQLLRRQWVQGEDVKAESARIVDSGTELHDAFEHRLTTADDMADRLRREANRVLKLATLQSAQDAEQERAERLATQMHEVVSDRASLDNSWQQLWSESQVVPSTAREMRAWLDKFETLRAGVERTLFLQGTLSDLEKRNAEHISLLADQTKALGFSVAKPEDLASMLFVSESAADELDAAAVVRNNLTQELKQLENDIGALDNEYQVARRSFDAWKFAWDALMLELALPPSLQPAEMDELIDNVRTLFDKQGEAAKRTIRITSIDKSNEAFCKQVVLMVAALSPEHQGLPAAEAVVKLNSLLTENLAKHTKQLHFEEQIKQADDDIVESTALIESMNQTLHSLCREAKCDDYAGLSDLEKRSAEYKQIRSLIAANALDIANVSDGLAIEELQLQADSIEPDALPSAIEQLQNRIDDELEPERSELTERKGREKAELEQMDGGNSAAMLAESASGMLAGIRTDAEQYVRVKLAARILREHIERFRQENQGPLIKRASEHFAALTLQSFRELVTDFNDKDEPVLTGVRHEENKQVKVEGMSSGTRDQLYLALRLASLDKYAVSADPMPFIVDDVLIEFDDARSMAALQSLADMSKTTQIILFTHHSRILEQSGKIKGDVCTHRL